MNGTALDEETHDDDEPNAHQEHGPPKLLRRDQALLILIQGTRHKCRIATRRVEVEGRGLTVTH